MAANSYQRSILESGRFHREFEEAIVGDQNTFRGGFSFQKELYGIQGVLKVRFSSVSPPALREKFVSSKWCGHQSSFYSTFTFLLYRKLLSSFLCINELKDSIK